jgi:hypothetical protein
MMGGDGCFQLQLMPSLMQLSIEAAQMALEQEMPVHTAGEVWGLNRCLVVTAALGYS